MQLPKEIVTVTKLSKIVALIMFITLPVIAFLFGMRYQTMLTGQATIPPISISPIISQTPSFCGGIAGKVCPSGYYCKYDGTYPDAGGTCIKDKVTTKHICPKTEYADCMPGPGTVKAECSTAFLQWATANCPNFKGAAY